MLSSLNKVQIYTVNVKPVACVGWTGAFNFNPSAEDVAAAIRENIADLKDGPEPTDNPEIDHFMNALELVVCQLPVLSKQIKLAGMIVGWISVTGSKVFVREAESMMPALRPPTLITPDKGDRDNA